MNDDELDDSLEPGLYSDSQVQWHFENRITQGDGDYTHLHSLLADLLTTNGLMIGALSTAFRDNKEYASIALESSGAAYFYLSERLRNDKAIFFQAAKTGFFSAENIRPPLYKERVPLAFRSDPVVMAEAIGLKELNSYLVAPELSNDAEFLISLGTAGRFKALSTLVKRSNPELFNLHKDGLAIYQFLLASKDREMLQQTAPTAQTKGKPIFKL